MMDSWFFTSMALELVLLLALLLASRDYVRRSFSGRIPEAPPGPDPGGPFPRAALIVPLTGNSPEMPGCLKSLLNQDYPDYETILVTRDQQDPATTLVREVLAGLLKNS